MTVVNHAGVKQTDAPLVVLIIQMAASTAIAIASSGPRVVSQFGSGTLIWALTVPPLFVLMLGSSMLAFKFVSVGSFVVVRNLGPLVTLTVEAIFHGRHGVRCDIKSALSCAAIAVGVYIYASNDIKYSSVGVVILLFNLVVAVAERMAQRHLLAVRKVSVNKGGLVIINNGIGAVILLGFVFQYDLTQFDRLAVACGNTQTTAIVGLSCIVGTGIAYSGLWLQSRVRATTFMVIGCTCKLLVIVWGIVVEGDSANALAIAGALLSVAGATAYSFDQRALVDCWRKARGRHYSATDNVEMADAEEAKPAPSSAKPSQTTEAPARVMPEDADKTAARDEHATLAEELERIKQRMRDLEETHPELRPTPVLTTHDVVKRCAKAAMYIAFVFVLAQLAGAGLAAAAENFSFANVTTT